MTVLLSYVLGSSLTTTAQTCNCPLAMLGFGHELQMLFSTVVTKSLHSATEVHRCV